jgi:hypothetical protein
MIMTKLMDNELKTVAGGDVRDIIDDSVSLYNAGYMGEKYDSVLYIITHWDHCSSTTDEGWKRAGITSVSSFDLFSEYYLNGEKITKEEAYAYAGMPY